MNKPLRLLIVDDSALMRQTLRQMVADNPDICVVGEAADGREALQLVAAQRPDVITIDVQMPVMDGLETIEQLMAYYPTPVLVITASLSRYDADITFKMLDAGALDIMEKPQLSNAQSYEHTRRELIRRIKLLARIKVITHLRGRRRASLNSPYQEKHAEQQSARTRNQHLWIANNIRPHTRGSVSNETQNVPRSVVVIGASTGGPRVVRQILAGLPQSFGAAVIVVQHIALGFGAAMADWLAANCALPVRLAGEGEQLSAGTVLVAPEYQDLLIRHDGSVHLSSRPLLLQRPSIDITMQAAAEIFGTRTIGILLTGMGRDGAVGMHSIRRVGGYTIAQNEASCTIYGMPRAAIELNAVDAVLSPEEIIITLKRLVGV